MLRSILCVLGFYPAFWIAKSIFYSFLDGSTTMEFVTKGEWYIAGGVAFLICVAVTISDEVNGKDYFKSDYSFIYTCIPVVATIIVSFMPFSWGVVILYNVILIGCIGRAAYDG